MYSLQVETEWAHRRSKVTHTVRRGTQLLCLFSLSGIYCPAPQLGEQEDEGIVLYVNTLSVPLR